MIVPDTYPAVALWIHRGHISLQQGYRRVTMICNTI